jgi:putative radical SAM enzyme (TIGR03279 family)
VRSSSSTNSSSGSTQGEAAPPGAGLRLTAVDPGSDLARSGLQAGDLLLAIDGLAPRDVIDVQLDLPGATRLLVQRVDGRRAELQIPNGVSDAALLTLDDPVPGGIRECNNHCEFCFIRGLPNGLRSTLYVFDDDYRYSFLWGNFLTLTNLAEADWARIGYQRLSPINVSVHATDPSVRRRLLNNRHAPPILPQLERLAAQGIRVNAQVVLCAGINDGACLDQTIADLARLHPAVQSVSVVPVGLTRYSRTRTIRRPSPSEGETAVATCERWQALLRPKLGIGFAYASDELYLLAGRAALPSPGDYDGFPVLSNGVGMLRGMLDRWESLIGTRRGPPPPPRRQAWLTGQLAAPALRRMAERWQMYAGWQPDVVVVDNHLFGEQVTVSGLLSGADLVRTLHALSPDVEEVVLPRGAFGFDGLHTLDGISADDVGAAHRGRVYLAATPEELAAILG